MNSISELCYTSVWLSFMRTIDPHNLTWAFYAFPHRPFRDCLLSLWFIVFESVLLTMSNARSFRVLNILPLACYLIFLIHFVLTSLKTFPRKFKWDKHRSMKKECAMNFRKKECLRIHQQYLFRWLTFQFLQRGLIFLSFNY